MATPRSKEKAAHVEADYLQLVRQFPLKPLTSRREFERAGKILDHYNGREDLTTGERDYVAALARFVEDFEQKQATASVR